MSKHYRIIFECYDSSSSTENPLSSNVITSGSIEGPVDIFNFGFSHEDQIKILQGSQDSLLKEQSQMLSPEDGFCPHCSGKKLVKYGKRNSIYHDIFTDHNVVVIRKRCPECRYEPGATIKKIFGNSMSADLIKLQAELGSNHTYRGSEKLFNAFSAKKRHINNHDRIKHTVEDLGTQVGLMHKTESFIISAEPAEELILNVDGGHINTTEAGKRSFEAMTSVIYRPESLKSNDGETRNTLISKHCAASALSDGQQQMISNTILAALKQGLSPETKITALCDGADNCWQIVDALEPLSASVTRILDWFHITMKIKNISVPTPLKAKLEKVKWYLWRGNTEKALQRLTELMELCSEKLAKKLNKFINYIRNNQSKIVNYNERQEQGLPFTSNLAESTVESLINQRCKGQKHMRWSREGLDPLLQLRAAVASNDWGSNWKTAIMNMVTI